VKHRNGAFLLPGDARDKNFPAMPYSYNRWFRPINSHITSHAHVALECPGRSMLRPYNDFKRLANSPFVVDILQALS